jgi:hypothetical protein
MEKFIPFAKLSKKSQQAINKSHRKSWGNIDPVTKRPANSKAYNRKKLRPGKILFQRLSFFIILLSFKTKFIYIVD